MEYRRKENQSHDNQHLRSSKRSDIRYKPYSSDERESNYKGSRKVSIEVREERHTSKDRYHHTTSRNSGQYGPQSYPQELSNLFGPDVCQLCAVEFTSPVVQKMHYSGKQHAKNVTRFLTDWCRRTGSPMPQVDREATSSLTTNVEDYCQLCDVALKSLHEKLLHYSGKTHQRNERDPENIKRRVKCYETIDISNIPLSEVNGVLKATDEKVKVNMEMVQGFECELCNVKAVSQDQLQAHLEGKKHKERLEKKNASSERAVARRARPFKCDLCKVALETYHLYGLHLKGKRHAKTLAKQEQSHLSFDYCGVCNLNFTSFDQYQSHIQGRKHEKKCSEVTYQSTRSASDEKPSIVCKYCPYVGSNGDHKCDKSLATSDFKDLEKKWACAVCHNTVFDSEEAYNEHKNSRRHLMCVLNQEKGDKIVEELKYFYCYICKKQCLSNTEFSNHMFEERHQKLASEGSSVFSNINLFRCTVCDLTLVDQECKEEHIKDKKHLKLALEKDTLEYIRGIANKDIYMANLYCSHCLMSFSSFVKYSDHVLGDKHMDRVISKKLEMLTQ
uniref:C2H2-type domain-containing protein n=1 Tax=Graphocephala atropunctata TaxID=36148 RepID=A0A1B6MJ59_9HEMI